MLYAEYGILVFSDGFVLDRTPGYYWPPVGERRPRLPYYPPDGRARLADGFIGAVRYI